MPKPSKWMPVVCAAFVVTCAIITVVYVVNGWGVWWIWLFNTLVWVFNTSIAVHTYKRQRERYEQYEQEQLKTVRRIGGHPW